MSHWGPLAKAQSWVRTKDTSGAQAFSSPFRKGAPSHSPSVASLIRTVSQ